MFQRYHIILIEFLSLWIIGLITTSLADLATTRQEYCEYETFAPYCGDDEIVMVTEATYGRLRVGKCVPDKFMSELGCSTDVLDFMSRQCSGRQSCSFLVSKLVTEQGCPPSIIRSYLEISYACLRVAFPPVSKCQGNEPITLTNIGTEGYISSYITQKTSCGDKDNPWLISADIGQRINITLIDFVNIGSKDSGEEANYKCTVYGTIRDGNGAVTNTVCGGSGKKIIPVFLSTSNSIEVRLISKPVQQNSNDGHFLLKYTIEGCSDPDLPDNMWMKRLSDEALVGCKNGVQATWLLKCIRGIWDGQVGICSSVSGSASMPVQSKNKEIFINVAISRPILDTSTIKTENVEWYSALTKDTNIILLSGTVVFISVIFFILGVICVWSKFSRREVCNPMHVDHLTYGCKEFSYTRPLPPSYEMYPTTSRNALSSTVQTAMYPFSDTSSYNTVNNRLATREHIYESTFMPNGVVAKEDSVNDDTLSEHKYFVLDPKIVQLDCSK